LKYEVQLAERKHGMRWKEIETKYRVRDLKLTEFEAAAEALRPTKRIDAAGYDYYYTRGEDEFIRYRAGDLHQLTVKKKTKEANNYVRMEVNMSLDKANINLKTVDKFCDALGFSFNFRLFKSCFIYLYEKFNIVYYLVHDEHMDEVDRFLEIEMSEDAYWESDEQAWAELLKIEQALKTLGISPQSRLKLSLFEMFRKQ
jgi:hypothetical protein